MIAIPDWLCLGTRASGKSPIEQMRSPANYLSGCDQIAPVFGQQANQDHRARESRAEGR
jgi:hypothetical protein